MTRAPAATDDETAFPVAAIVAPKGVDPDALLTGLAGRLSARGLSVVGHVQASGENDAMVLVNVASGAATGISQDLGGASQGCRLDSGALAGVVGPLLAALERRPDLVIVNRFGKDEAEGRGFRTVFEKACELDVPVLTVVREAYLEDWRAMTGSAAHELPADPASLDHWIVGRVPSSAA
ncbi:hypothetical protein CSC94_11585 [Zhengella mangrovi]|uniref:3-dehydroquinate dehydratase n=1 Tax=Zhengella mangrovi TaxID=1982044 RepID=A0A2G1QMJ8_9HYPH|nr:DUF2478 domain-containing protein [Zhengella mangrovi]PHP66746.1 hypothetical protein CSC94_11585 [Zhengella mangrovi]